MLKLTVNGSITGIRDFSSDAAHRPAEGLYGHAQPAQTSDTVKYDSLASDLSHVEASRPAAVLTSGVPAFMASLLPQVGTSNPSRLPQ